MRNAAKPAAAAATVAAAAALGALVLGALVYLVDRPAGSAWLLPAQWQTLWQTQAGGPAGRWFGAAGEWLPSLVHAFGFSLLTALVLPRRRGVAAAACLGWAVVDTLAEVGQLPSIAAALAAALEAAFGRTTVAVHVGRYFTQGSFAWADVAAGIAGAVLAYALAHVLLKPSGQAGPACTGAAPPAGAPNA